MFGLQGNEAPEWLSRFREKHISNFEDEDNEMADAMIFARSVIEAQKESLLEQHQDHADLFDKIAIKVGFEVISAISELSDSENFDKTIWKCQRNATIVYRVTYYLHCYSASKDDKDVFPCGMINAMDMGLGKTIAATLMLYVSHNSARIVSGDEDDGFIEMAIKEVDVLVPVPENNDTSLVFVPQSLIVEWTETLNAIFGQRAVTVLNNPNCINNLDVFVDGECKVILLSVSMLQNTRKAGWIKGSKAWLNLIVDEAHIGVGSKNKTNTKVNASSIDAVSRIAVTATPDQGHINYIISLLEFCGIDFSREVTTEFVKDLCSRHMFRISREDAKEDIGDSAPPDPEYVNLVVNNEEKDPKVEAFGRLIQMANNIDTKAVAKISLSRQVVVNPSIVFDSRKRYKPPLKKLEDQLPKFEDLPTSGKFPEERLISPVIQKMVDDIVARPHSEKHVIMCHFTEELHAIVHALDAANIRSFIFSGETSCDDKNQMIRSFKRFVVKARRAPVLVCNIQCGSVGLNLQCANNIYFPTSDWNHQRELQAIARLNRSGQKNTIRVVFVRHHMDTTDQHIQAIQYRKIQHCNGILGESIDVNRHIQRLKEGEELAKRKAALALESKKEPSKERKRESTRRGGRNKRSKFVLTKDDDLFSDCEQDPPTPVQKRTKLTVAQSKAILNGLTIR